MKPKIDILMATYNGEKYIEEQLKSIISQSCENWNLVIRDDGSDDNTLRILNEYSKRDKRIHIISDNKGNLGLVKNFEELMKHSTEEYIMFSDQDDAWADNKINILLQKMQETEEKMQIKKPILVHSNSYICDEELNIKKNRFISKKANEVKIENVFFNFIVQGAAIMINKELKNLSLPFFNEVYLHDRYLHLLAELFGKRIFIDKPLNYYRQHGKNLIGSSKINIMNEIFHRRFYYKNDRLLIKKIYDLFSKDIELKTKEAIEAYLKITSAETGRFKKLKLLRKNKIYLPIKKKVFLVLKG